MRSTLRWALAATLALTLVALWWPARKPAVIAAVERPGSEAETTLAKEVPTPLSAHLPAWDELPPVPLEPAQRDIFGSAVANTAPTVPQAAVKAPAAPPAMAVYVPPPAAQPVVVPGVSVRYLGSMRTPAGERLVLLARADSAYVARVGLQFEDGYAVHSITEQAVRLVHAASGTTQDIPVPASVVAGSAAPVLPLAALSASSASPTPPGATGP